MTDPGLDLLAGERPPWAGSRVSRRKWGENGHRYQLDGEWVQGVTTILNALAKPALIDWAAREVAAFARANWSWLSTIPEAAREDLLKGAHNKVRDAAAKRGSDLHDAVVPLLRGEPIDADPEVYDLAQHAVAFMDDWGIRPLLIETVVWREEPRYAGTLDLVATADRYPGRVFLIDWKTNRRGIYPEVALQLSAYANADYYVDADGDDQPMAALGITDHLALRLTPEGYEVQPTLASPEVFEVFQIVAAVSSRASASKLKGLLLEGLPS